VLSHCVACDRGIFFLPAVGILRGVPVPTEAIVLGEHRCLRGFRIDLRSQHPSSRSIRSFSCEFTSVSCLFILINSAIFKSRASVSHGLAFHIKSKYQIIPIP
jgi:hypothetical protein